MTTEETRHYHRRTADQWRVLIEQFNHSEQSGAAFCRDNAIAYASFCKWRQRYSSTENRANDTTEISDPAFIDLSLLPRENPKQAQWHIVLKLGNGVELCLSQLDATA